MNKIAVNLYRNKNEAVIDAFDSIVVSFYMEKIQHKHSTFMVTGCNSGTGTTSSCVELALALAVSGWKVVLVDMDIRKENQYKRLNENIQYGITDYVAESEITIEDLVYPTNCEGLNYIACGKLRTQTAVQTLCSQRMENLLNELAGLYDFVICDTPSLNSAADAKIVAQKVDCTYLVAASNETTFRNIEFAREQMKDAGANVVGVIVNKLEEVEYRQYLSDYDYFRKQLYLSKVPGKNAARKETASSKIAGILRKLLEGIALIFCVLGLCEITKTSARADSSSTGDYFPNGRAVVMVDDYSIVNGEAAPGEDFTLQLNVVAKNPLTEIYDLYVTLEIETQGICLRDGESNQHFAGNLKAGSHSTIEFNLTAAQELNAEYLYFKVGFSYLDSEHKQALNEVNITPSVTQTDYKITVKHVSTADRASVGADVLLSLQYENSGNRDIDNLYVQFSGDLAGGDKEVQLDAIKEGKTAHYEDIISFDKSGNRIITITFVAEDPQTGARRTLYTVSKSVLVQPDSDNSGTLGVIVEQADHTAVQNIFKNVFGSGNGTVIRIIIVSSSLAIIVILIRLMQNDPKPKKKDSDTKKSGIKYLFQSAQRPWKNRSGKQGRESTNPSKKGDKEK